MNTKLNLLSSYMYILVLYIVSNGVDQCTILHLIGIKLIYLDYCMHNIIWHPG